MALTLSVVTPDTARVRVLSFALKDMKEKKEWDCEGASS